jgi:hypothetical protein
MQSETYILFIYAFFLQLLSYNILAPFIGLLILKHGPSISFSKRNFFILFSLKLASSIIAIFVIQITIAIYITLSNKINDSPSALQINYDNPYLIGSISLSILIFILSFILEYPLVKKYIFSDKSPGESILTFTILQILLFMILLLYYYIFYSLYYL